jgi:hypothetical protein
MNEDEFLKSIDANFPYGDKKACFVLINKSVTISDNASFAILESICCKPFGHPILAEEQHELISVWKEINTHPVKDYIVEAAIACVDLDGLAEEKVLRYMDELKPYKNQFKALMILHASVDDTATAKYQNKFNEITDIWKNA